MKRSLQRLLKPRSIASIGGREAERVVEQALSMGFRGDVWPVHPTKKHVCGLKCFNRIADLPNSPDAAYVAVNRHHTIDVVRELSGIGAGGAICYASGFSEADCVGQSLQEKLLLEAGNMPVIGPNCYGMLNYADGISMWPDQHGGKRLEDVATGVAIITQSSNIAINITMQKRGLPVAFVLTAGNQAQIGLSEMALELLDDPRVTVLGLHIEGFDSVKGMEAVAEKSRHLKKPVLAMKIGGSRQAQEAAFTHTAALSSADHVAEAFLKRIGVARVFSLSAFLETLKLLHCVGSLEGYSISSLSCSGGEAALMADAIIGRKIRFREMTSEEKKPIEAALGPLVTVTNPLDYHTYIWRDRIGLEAAFSGMLSAGFDLNCLIMDFPRSDRCKLEDWEIPLEAWINATRKTGAKTCLIASLPENMDEEKAKMLINLGIAPLSGLEGALEAIEAAANIGETWKQAGSTSLTDTVNFCGQQQIVLDEAEGKSLISEYGLVVPYGIRATNLKKLREKAELIGFPVALKALGIAHKSEKSAVYLNLEDQNALKYAAEKLFDLSDKLYIESMVQKPVFELLVGVLHDPQFGLVMTLATGGVMVEVFDDSQTLLLPFERADAEYALRNLKSAVLFDGFRGKKRADYDATVNSILQIKDFALAHRDQLIELDINPLIICEGGHSAIVADVLIKFGSVLDG